MSLTRSWRLLDWPLLGGAIVVLLYGLAAIYSATYHTFHHADFDKQLLFLVPSGIAISWLVAAGYNWLEEKVMGLSVAFWLYWINVAVLLAIMKVGHRALGAQRWIRIAGITIQPSELAKLIIIISLARLLSTTDVRTRDGFLKAVGCLAIPMLLIFKQPDLGTSLVFGGIALGMFYWAGISGADIFKLVSFIVSPILKALGWKAWLAYLLGLALFLFLTRKGRERLHAAIFGGNLVTGLARGFVWKHLKEYQRKRLTVFLDPESDPRDAGYHIIQSKIAIGSGGFWGKGFLHGTQTQLHFIPEQQTDFIFSVVGEEGGFLICLLLLAVYLVMLVRGVIIARTAKDQFGSLLAIGVVSMLLFHIFVNIGMAIGIMPVVGIPLPLMSYGGTALLTNLCGIGLLEAIYMRHKKLHFRC